MKNFVYRFLFVVAAVALFPTSSQAADCISAGSGNWTAITWANCASGPQSDDTVQIREGDTVTFNVATATYISGLELCDTACGASTILQDDGNNRVLFVNGPVTIHGGSTSGSSVNWNIAGGTAQVGGLITFDPQAAQSGRDAKITISTGTLVASSNIAFENMANAEDNQVLTITGAGTVDQHIGYISGASYGNIDPGTTSTYIYSATGQAQTINFDATGSTYANLVIKNTSASGATLGAAITTSNVTGDMTVGDDTVSAVFDNGGYAITGTSGKTFLVNNNATFIMSGTSPFPGGFSTFTFDPNSTVRYTQTDGQTITNATYGNLELKPAGATQLVLPATLNNLAGNLVIGDGTAGHAGATGANNPSFSAVELTINANATFTTGTGTITLTGTGTPFTKTGTFTASTNNTFNYTGNGATTTAATYYNLGLKPSSSSAQVLGGGTYTVNNDLTIGDGSIGHAGATGDANDPVITAKTLTIANNAEFVTGSGSLTLIGSGDAPFTKNGTFTASTGHTFVYQIGVSSFATTPATYYNLSLNTGSLFSAISSGDYTINNNFAVSGDAGTGFVLTNPVNMTIGGNLSISTTTFTAGTSTTIGGSFINAGGFSHNSGTVIFDTSNSGKTIGGAATFYNLTLNKSGQTISLNNDITVNHTLDFTAGTITTGASKVIIPSTGSISRTSGYVVGNLQMYMPTGTTSKTFVIGDSSNYTPVDVAFGNVSAAGYLTAYATSGDHPDIANSGINSSKSVNRYWSMTKDGSLDFNNYSATFNFVPGDIDGGADYNSFIVAKDTSGVWSKPTVGTKTSTSTQATGLTAFSDFQLGEEGAGGASPAADISGGVDLSGGVTITTQ